MSEETTASDAEAVPSDVAKAARLWAGDRQYPIPEYAGWADHFVWTTLRKVVFVLILLAVGAFMAVQARGLIGMLVIATFFALAIIPGVNALHNRYGMRRGAAVAVVYLIAFVTTAILVLVLIPVVVTFAAEVQAGISGWVDTLNAWTEENFGGTVVATDDAQKYADEFLNALKDWGSNVFGILTSGIGFIFDLVTIAAFTFYIAVGFPNLRRAVMTRMPPERQRVFAWITDQSIEQTGGYFYSRLLLMIVNGGLGFAVMVILGMPVVYAVAMALFMGFVSAFIPFIGTYIGAAIPILLMLATQGPVPALLFLGWILIYQQLENYWLSPRFSSKTMELNGAVAFGSAIAGGAIAGPMGAFMALPVAALITAVAKNAGKTYAVVVEDLDGPDLGGEATAPADPKEPPRWQFWRK
jgi:predicted PurR-regulated permease PerM